MENIHNRGPQIWLSSAVPREFEKNPGVGASPSVFGSSGHGDLESTCLGSFSGGSHDDTS